MENIKYAHRNRIRCDSLQRLEKRRTKESIETDLIQRWDNMIYKTKGKRDDLTRNIEGGKKSSRQERRKAID